MGLYSKKELIIKSRKELLRIAFNEKLVDVIKSDELSKKDLIELILKYRKDYTKFKITNYNEYSFFKLQEKLNEKFLRHSTTKNDIEIVRSIRIYEKTKYIKKDNYFVLIDKQLEIDVSIVLLVGNNNYIYGILNLELDDNYLDIRYNRYIISYVINRIDENYKNDEQMKLVFFDSFGVELIYKIYNNKSSNVIPEKLVCYEENIIEFIYCKLEKVINSCPILVLENRVVTKYFDIPFIIYVEKIEDNEIKYIYSKKTLIRMKSKNYEHNNTIFLDINYLLKNSNEMIKIYDEFLNFKFIKKSEILKNYLLYIKEKIISYSKKKYSKFNLIGVEYKNDEFKTIDIKEILNYNIMKNIKENSKPYLIINTTNNNMEISINKYNKIEREINYEFNIITQIIYRKKFSKIQIIELILKYLKHKICNIDYIKYSKKEIINKINNNGYQQIIDDIKRNYDLLEDKFKTEYLKYKMQINEIYINSYKNYLILYEVSEYLFEKYLNYEIKNYTIKEILANLQINDFEIRDFNIQLNDIEKIFIIEMYNLIYTYFNNVEILEILKNYQGINISGKILKTDIFYNLLKEYIPGRLINFEKENIDTYKFLIDTAYNMDLDLKFGRVKINSKLLQKKENISIYVRDFKKEYKLILNTKSKNTAYIDRLETVSNLDIKFVYEDEKEEKEITYLIEKDFIEKDELLANYNQEKLNDIDNNIIRIFFKLEENIEIKFILRKNDQLFVSQKSYFINYEK